MDWPVPVCGTPILIGHGLANASFGEPPSSLDMDWPVPVSGMPSLDMDWPVPVSGMLILIGHGLASASFGNALIGHGLASTSFGNAHSHWTWTGQPHWQYLNAPFLMDWPALLEDHDTVSLIDWPAI